MLNTEDVYRSIADQIKEAQLKLGYSEGAVRLYYLASSMALLGGYGDIAASAEELAEALAEDEGLRSTPLGTLSFAAVSGNRVCVTVRPEGVRYVHEQLPDPPFLTAIVGLFGGQHHSHGDMRAEVERLLARFGAFDLREMPADAGFDFMARFEDPQIDPYLYCFKDEMGHMTYHRFSEGDFRLRWPEVDL